MISDLAPLECFVNLMERNTPKKVTLPTLDIEIEVPGNYYYHDDGVVKDLNEHRRKLIKKYGGCPIPDTSAKCSCYLFIDDKVEGIKDLQVHTFYLEGYDDLLLRGHEETHALLFLTGMPCEGSRFVLGTDSLKRALEEKGVKAYTLDREDVEVVCDIGGLYAVYNANPYIKYLGLRSMGNTAIKAVNWLMKNSDIIAGFSAYKVDEQYYDVAIGFK